MEKYLIKKPRLESTPQSNVASIPLLSQDPPERDVSPIISSRKFSPIIDIDSLPSDPALRPPITSYHPKVVDEVRLAYLTNGPTRTWGHKYKKTPYGKKKVMRRFNEAWFKKYSYWLEYSIKEEVAYCLCCYLFKQDIGQQSGGDTFVSKGFSNWKKSEVLVEHEGGGPNSAHNIAVGKCRDLKNQGQHYSTFAHKMEENDKRDYRIRLKASIKCIKYLLHQGLAFRGHGESEESNNQGNFLELLEFHAEDNEEIGRVVLNNAPQNHKMTSPSIQKDIVQSIACEITKFVVKDIGEAFFSILVDEARDVSCKEQMAIVIRYVDKRGKVIERLLGIEHVENTNASTLKDAMSNLLQRHDLCISKMRGQGYDGASNMQGEFNGLKAKVLEENPYAFYVHCFAHQLQLALVGLARKHDYVDEFFGVVSRVLNVVGGSCKRVDILELKQLEKVQEGLKCGDLKSGRGTNQETNLQRAGDTRWSSHYNSLASLVNMFAAVIDVLEIIGWEGDDGKRSEAKRLLDTLQSFEFIFLLFLMRKILGMTSVLSQALQRKDQDIVNAMNLVHLTKLQLQTLRNGEWDSFLLEVTSFCGKHDIDVPNMDDVYVSPGRVRRKVLEMPNDRHYRIDLFLMVIDMQARELDNRFSISSTELLLCMASLCPSNSFSRYDKEKLIRFAEFYPLDFSQRDYEWLGDQLDTYIIDMRSSSECSSLSGIGDLAKMMVDTNRDKIYPSIYKLITLALTLPVATASVERAFSAMNIIKNRLRNRMGDKFMNDSLLVSVEKDILKKVDYETIMKNFQVMRPRREQI